MGTELATDIVWTWGWYEEVQEVELHTLKFSTIFQWIIGVVSTRETLENRPKGKLWNRTMGELETNIANRIEKIQEDDVSNDISKAGTDVGNG